MLTIAQWGLNVDESKYSIINFPIEYIEDNERYFMHVVVNTLCNRSGENNEVANQGIQQLRDLLVRIHSMRIDHTEYACLKALVLFKTGAILITIPHHSSRIES